MAGFEGSTGYNCRREWMDAVSTTRHDTRMHEDYALLRSVGIKTVRESVRWPLVDRRSDFNLSLISRTLEASKQNGIAVIHDLFHFGYPMHLDPLSTEFQKCFADYCYKVARYVAQNTEGVCYFTPLNEPSYFAWAGGEAGLFAPYLKGRGPELKAALVAAAIQGIEAIWAASPAARIVNVDPCCRVVAACEDQAQQGRVETFNSSIVFEAWDILAGRQLPELGGSRRHLGIVGINYYWRNQWEIDRPDTPLADDDPRRLRLAEIVRIVWDRYRAEILITETSHVGDMRAEWLRELTAEVESVWAMKIPLSGVCWYPILEMPEWHATDQWTRMGLWDLDHERGTMNRVPHAPTIRAFREAQERLQYRQLKEFPFCA